MGNRDNFTMVDNSIIRGESVQLSNGAFRLYVLLQSYCYGKRKLCWPNQETLSLALGGVDRTTIYRYERELIERGLITVKLHKKPVTEHDGKMHRSSTYVLNYYEPWETDADE